MVTCVTAQPSNETSPNPRKIGLDDLLDLAKDCKLSSHTGLCYPEASFSYFGNCTYLLQYCYQISEYFFFFRICLVFLLQLKLILTLFVKNLVKFVRFTKIVISTIKNLFSNIFVSDCLVHKAFVTLTKRSNISQLQKPVLHSEKTKLNKSHCYPIRDTKTTQK